MDLSSKSLGMAGGVRKTYKKTSWSNTKQDRFETSFIDCATGFDFGENVNVLG